VPVGLADGAQRDLCDLGATTDDDDPLAKDPVQRSSETRLQEPGQTVDGQDEGILVDAFDLDLELCREAGGSDPAGRSCRSARSHGSAHRRAVVTDAPNGAQCPQRAARGADPLSQRLDRLRRVLEDESDRNSGRRGRT
jgi:hypothetical protein